MKRFLVLLVLFTLLAFPSAALAAGTNTVSLHDLGEKGIVVSIAAVADASAATFVPELFVDTAPASTYNKIKGRHLTSVRTTPGFGLSAPTGNYDIYVVDGMTSTSDFVLNTPGLAIGSDTSAVATAAFAFVIDGAAYAKTAVAAGTEPGNDVIVQAKYGAVAFDIGANGTIDVIEATGQAAAQFTTAALAVAALPACASDHVRLGYITATKSDGAFTFGTTALNAANSTVAYYSTVPQYSITGTKLENRSATASEWVPMTDADGAAEYPFISEGVMVIPVNNAVNSATITIKLCFN